MFTGKGNSLEPDRAKQVSAIPLNSLFRLRTGGSEGRICGSHTVIISANIFSQSYKNNVISSKFT